MKLPLLPSGSVALFAMRIADVHGSAQYDGVCGMVTLLPSDELLQVAQARLEDKTNTEIAAKMILPKRLIGRKLNLIREDLIENFSV